MTETTLTPGYLAVERLLAARVAHGDSPHTVRALRGDLEVTGTDPALVTVEFTESRSSARRAPIS